jgi:hypothetical protein
MKTASNQEGDVAARHPSAFTLIELLVLVTIIVLLLALLAPALDKAIYQAELATCGAKLKSVGSAAVQYALEARRSYPDRGFATRDPDTSGWISPQDLVRPVDLYDMRPPLRGYMAVNKQLQCPMTDQLDLEDTRVDENVFASYAMWWAWRYNVPNAPPTRGMFKVGDRWTWKDTRFSILAGDYDALLHDDSVQASHPDRAGLLSLLSAKYKSLTGTGVGDVQANAFTLSVWHRGKPAAIQRGLIDVNSVFDDGSVGRLLDVKDPNDRDPRTERTPFTFNARSSFVFQVPIR